MNVYVVWCVIGIDEFEILKVFDSEDKALTFISCNGTLNKYQRLKYGYDVMKIE